MFITLLKDRATWIQFGKYFFIGVSAFVLDLGSLFYFKTYLHWHPVNAVIVNQLFIVVYVFLLNKHWAFGAAGMTHHQAVRFIFLAVCNYFFAAGWLWFWLECISLTVFGPSVDYLFFRMANVVLAVGWNFLLYKFWVYR